MTESRARKSSFAVDVLKLAGGTTFAQAMSMVLAPILARIFAPEAFGLMAIFVSITGIIQVVTCLRYELSIMLPETDEEAANLLAVSLVATVLVSLLTVPLVIFGGPLIITWLKAPELQSFFWLIPIVAFINGVFLALNYWNTRTKHFMRLSFAQMVSSVSNSVGKLVLGLAGYPSGGTLIGTTVFGSFISTSVLGAQIWRDDNRLLRNSFHWRKILDGAQRHYKFPLYNTWAALLNTLSWQLPVFVLSGFFSPVIVGYYAQGNRIVRLPMSLIGSSISQVFYQRASAAVAEGTLQQVVMVTFKQLVAFSLFPLLIMAIAGDDLFSFILGERWHEAGVYNQILAGWTFFWFISSPLSSLYNVFEKHEALLRLQVVIFLSRLVSLGIGGLLGNPRLCLLLFALSGVVVYGHLSFSILNDAGISPRAALQIIFTYFLLFVPAGVLLLIMKAKGAAPWLVLCVATLALGLYGLYLIWTDRQIRALLAHFFPSQRLMPN